MRKADVQELLHIARHTAKTIDQFLEADRNGGCKWEYRGCLEDCANVLKAESTKLETLKSSRVPAAWRSW